MNTEITDTIQKQPSAGWILYDGTCHLCTGQAQRWDKLLTARGFELAPLQSAWVARRFDNETDDALLQGMRYIHPDGRIFVGADALLEIAHHFWWAAPIRWMAAIPEVQELYRRLYFYIAAHRYCFNGACEITHQPRRHHETLHPKP